jgi:DNA-directed RNA polymerase subunit H (RpoH/RPB5)
VLRREPASEAPRLETDDPMNRAIEALTGRIVKTCWIYERVFET